MKRPLSGEARGRCHSCERSNTKWTTAALRTNGRLCYGALALLLLFGLLYAIDIFLCLSCGEGETWGGRKDESTRVVGDGEWPGERNDGKARAIAAGYEQ